MWCWWKFSLLCFTNFSSFGNCEHASIILPYWLISNIVNMKVYETSKKKKNESIRVYQEWLFLYPHIFTYLVTFLCLKINMQPQFWSLEFSSMTNQAITKFLPFLVQLVTYADSQIIKSSCLYKLNLLNLRAWGQPKRLIGGRVLWLKYNILTLLFTHFH